MSTDAFPARGLRRRKSIIRSEMPYTINKVKGGYSVRSPHGVKAKKTSLEMAEAQRRLLQGVKHGMVVRRK